MLNGAIKCKINLDKIPNHLLKPFLKNELDLKIVIISLVSAAFVIIIWLIYATEPLQSEIYYYFVDYVCIIGKYNI